jgi:hypothetical protein
MSSLTNEAPFMRRDEVKSFTQSQTRPVNVPNSSACFPSEYGSPQRSLAGGDRK